MDDVIKKRVAKKVIIEIYNTDPIDGVECRYCDDAANSPGQLYTHVGFLASRYGGTGGCKYNDETEIQSTIEQYKHWIISEGDIPIIKDYR